jgi:putative transposase
VFCGLLSNQRSTIAGDRQPNFRRSPHVPHSLPLTPSDLSDAEWALLEPLPVSAERRGRPPKWPARRVADAGLSTFCAPVAPGGCSRESILQQADRLLPPPPKWRLDGRLLQVPDRLRAAVSEAERRARDPSGAVIDTQALRSTGVGGPERGYDGAKRLAGRKRHLLVDTSVLVLSAHVHAASLHDGDGGQRLLTEQLKEEMPRLAVAWADAAYTGWFREWVGEKRGGRVEAPPDTPIKSLATLPGGGSQCPCPSRVPRASLPRSSAPSSLPRLGRRLP